MQNNQIVGYALFFSILQLLTVIGCAPEHNKETSDKGNYELIAHRGGVVNDTILENSAEALKEAIKRGYIMVELDVRFTKDGVPITHHDADFLGQYGDSTLVSSITAAELSKIQHPELKTSPLTLEEYVTLTEGKIGLLLDIKGENHPYAHFQTIVDILKRYDMYDQAMVAWSPEAKAFFSRQESIKLNLNAPEFTTQYENNRDSIDTNVHFLIEDAKVLDSTIIYRAKELGLPIIATINIWHYEGISNHLATARKDAERMKSYGIDTFQIDAVYEPFFR